MNNLQIIITFMDNRTLTLLYPNQEFSIEKGSRSTYDESNTNTTYLEIITHNVENIYTIENAINQILSELLDLNQINFLSITDLRENSFAPIELQANSIRFFSISHRVDADRNIGIITIYINPEYIPQDIPEGNNETIQTIDDPIESVEDVIIDG